MSRENINYDKKYPFTANLTKKYRIELGQMKSYITFQVTTIVYILTLKSL